jgi:hypothetical protein
VVWFGKFEKWSGVVWCGLVLLDWRLVWCGVVSSEKRQVWCGVDWQNISKKAWCGVVWHLKRPTMPCELLIPYFNHKYLTQHIPNIRTSVWTERLDIPVAGVVSHVYQISRFHWMGLRGQGVIKESPPSVALLENISYLEVIKSHIFLKKVFNFV